MTAARSARRPLPALAVVALLLGGIAVLLSLGPQDPNFRRDTAGFVAFVCAFAAFGLVGALIVWQRPGNVLGWLLAADGLLAVWGASADTYADIAYEAGSSTDPLFLAAVWLSLWYWFPLLGLTMIFTPLLFPDGKPPSPRWRPVAWAAGLVLALMTFLAAFRERIEFPGISMDNPLGIPGIQDPEENWIGSVTFGLLYRVAGRGAGIAGGPVSAGGGSATTADQMAHVRHHDGRRDHGLRGPRSVSAG